MRSRWIRVVLAASMLLSLDALVAFLWFLPGGASQAHAPEKKAQTASSLRNEVLQEIGREIEERRRAIAEHEERLLEILRGEEVLRRARVFLEEETGAEAATGAGGAAPAASPAVPPGGNPAGDDAFVRLQRAYENMEPESAARALEKLAAKDQEAVVALLLGWKPRTSGAILDAIAQGNASLAAELSYEIWKRRQAPAGEAATPRR